MSLITNYTSNYCCLGTFFIFFYLESIATQSDATSRVFNMDKEELTRTSVTSLFKKQCLDWSVSYLWGFISRIA